MFLLVVLLCSCCLRLVYVCRTPLCCVCVALCCNLCVVSCFSACSVHRFVFVLLEIVLRVGLRCVVWKYCVLCCV